MDDPEKWYTVTPCMDVYKAKIQSDRIIDKLNFRIVFRGDFHHNKIIEDTWYPTASMRNLKYLLTYSANHKSRVHQLDFFEEFIQSNVKHRVFIKGVAVSSQDTPHPPLPITTSRTGCAGQVLGRRGHGTVRQGRPVKNRSAVGRSWLGIQWRINVAVGGRDQCQVGP